MKLNIQLKYDIYPKIIIQITSNNDPLILYLLELTELEYEKIMKEQKILINFNDFPKFLLNLAKLCSGGDDQNYSAVLDLNELPEVIFKIEEKIKFKISEHILLKLRKANDEELKKYLSTIYLELKNKYKNLFNKFNEINIKNENLNKEIIFLNENIKKNEYENKNNLGNLISEKDNKINLLKEDYKNESKKQMQLCEKEKQNIINKYEKKILDMEKKIDILTKNNQELETNILKCQINQKNCEGQYDISNNELKEKIKENKMIK